MYIRSWSVGIGRKSCLYMVYTIFWNIVNWRDFLPIPTGSAVCIWRKILIFHFASLSIHTFLFSWVYDYIKWYKFDTFHTKVVWEKWRWGWIFYDEINYMIFKFMLWVAPWIHTSTYLYKNVYFWILHVEIFLEFGIEWKEHYMIILVIILVTRVHIFGIDAEN